jgi:hypothetical protein
VEQIATILLGLVALALLIQLATNGPDGARAWMAAKFLGSSPA